ncbi:MAG: dihydrofolate reductase family protein [Balneolales bacterium]|nr:dihydrofolate reductase family protein [Balneolales bacterium]
MKCSVYIATSLDGFIAKPDGDIEWLDHPDYILKDKKEDFGFYAFMDSVDALVMGRHTFEKVLSFGEWPYEKPVIVLSSKNIALPEHLQGKVLLMNGSPEEIVKKSTESGFRHLYIDGGKTIQQFLNAGLIDVITITRIPVLLGQGIPLFGETEYDINLELISCSEFENGFVMLTYEPIYPGKT